MAALWCLVSHAYVALDFQVRGTANIFLPVDALNLSLLTCFSFEHFFDFI